MLLSLPTHALVAASLALLPPNSAIASSAQAGSVVFQTKCVACHEYGANAISPAKNLKIDVLEANGYASQEALANLVSNGKGQMPKYGPSAPEFGRLTDEQIADVVAYVREQADLGWPRS